MNGEASPYVKQGGGGTRMKEIGNRIHPRVYNKKCTEDTETVLNMNVTTAVGILVATFINGVIVGCLIRKKTH